MADLDDLNIQLTGIDSNLTIMHGLQEETNLLLKRIVDLLKELIDETKRSRDCWKKPEAREDIEDLTDELAHTFVATHDPEIKKPGLLLLGLRLSLREYVIARPGSFYPAGIFLFQSDIQQPC
jgi:hypothetical protein